MKNKGLTVVIGLVIISLFSVSPVMGEIGVKGGVMLSKMDIGSDSTNGTWSVLGWRADAFYSLSLSPSILFKPGITLSMERAKYFESPGMQHETFSIFFIKTLPCFFPNGINYQNYFRDCFASCMPQCARFWEL